MIVAGGGIPDGSFFPGAGAVLLCEEDVDGVATCLLLLMFNDGGVIDFFVGVERVLDFGAVEGFALPTDPASVGAEL